MGSNCCKRGSSETIPGLFEDPINGKPPEISQHQVCKIIFHQKLDK